MLKRTRWKTINLWSQPTLWPALGKVFQIPPAVVAWSVLLPAIVPPYYLEGQTSSLVALRPGVISRRGELVYEVLRRGGSGHLPRGFKGPSSRTHNDSEESLYEPGGTPFWRTVDPHQVQPWLKCYRYDNQTL